MIYLDNAATTYPKPESVYKALDEANRQLAFNSGRGSYKGARKATQLIDSVKCKLLKLVKAENRADVVLTPSITIALNQILQGIDFAKGDVVYISPYEHNAVARVVHLLEKQKGIIVKEMPLTTDTLEIDIDKLQYMFSKDKPKCVCCIHVSNVTGYILPVGEIFDIAKKYDAITVLDTAQSLGVIEISDKWLIDFLAFTGHKTLYGPFGIGGFVDYGKYPLNEVIVGGTGSDSLNLDMPDGTPYRYESSSANIVAVAGLNAAMDKLNIDEAFQHKKVLTRYLVDELKKVPGIIVYEPPEDQHIGTVSFNIKGYKAEDIGMILDEDFDIAVRTGYHCAPHIHKYLNDKEYVGTVRVGLGRYNDKRDVDKIVGAIWSILE